MMRFRYVRYCTLLEEQDCWRYKADGDAQKMVAVHGSPRAPTPLVLMILILISGLNPVVFFFRKESDPCVIPTKCKYLPVFWQRYFQSSRWEIVISLQYCIVILGVVMICVLAIGPKVRGFSPGRGWFLRAIKIRSTSSFGGGVKPLAPCKIIRHIKNHCGVTDSASAKFDISRQLPDSVLDVSAAAIEHWWMNKEWLELEGGDAQ
jgi:hypothetical protein